MNDVRRHGANLDQPVMLDKNRIASQVAMYNGGITCCMQIIESRQDLGAPSLPGLHLDFTIVPLGLAQKLLQGPRGHELRDKHKPSGSGLTGGTGSASIICPITVEFDNVGMINQSQSFEHFV